MLSAFRVERQVHPAAFVVGDLHRVDDLLHPQPVVEVALVALLLRTEQIAPLSNSPMKMSPSSMLVRAIVPVAAVIRSGMKLCSTPTTEVRFVHLLSIVD
jgi:hypothetical protein